MGCGASSVAVSVNSTITSSEATLLSRAVSLRWLSGLAKNRWKVSTLTLKLVDGEGAWLGKPIHQIVEEHVKPQTSLRKCSYASTLIGKTGAADYFVSYAWSSQDMLEVLFALLEHLFPMRKDRYSMPDDADDLFVWLDIFAVNQHPGPEQQLNLSQLDSVIRNAKHGTLVLFGTEGQSLTRIWCLYEMWKTIAIRGQAQLHILMHQAKRGTSLVKHFENLDLDDAKSTIDSDKQRILADVAASNTPAATVINALREAISVAALGAAMYFVRSLWSLSDTNIALQTKKQLRFYFDCMALKEQQQQLFQSMSASSSSATPSSSSSTSLRLKCSIAHLPDEELRDLPWFPEAQKMLLDTINAALETVGTFQHGDKAAAQNVWRRMQQVSPLLRPIKP